MAASGHIGIVAFDWFGLDKCMVPSCLTCLAQYITEIVQNVHIVTHFCVLGVPKSKKSDTNGTKLGVKNTKSLISEEYGVNLVPKHNQLVTKLDTLLK